MRSSRLPRVRCYTWRSFDRNDGIHIQEQLRSRAAPCCPCCGLVLEATPGTRLARHLPLDATGYDVECRDCRRFWCIVRHTARSLRLMRMRRLLAAVRAVGGATAADRTAEQSSGARAAA